MSYYPNPDVPESQLATYAALETIHQGHSWRMHDMLFADQTHRTVRNIKRYAKRIGLDTARFEQALEREIHRERLEKDVAMGASIGLKETPTLYLNGRRINGALEYRAIEAAVKQEIDRANQAIVEGAAPERLYQIFTSD